MLGNFIFGIFITAITIIFTFTFTVIIYMMCELWKIEFKKIYILLIMLIIIIGGLIGMLSI